MEQSCSFVQHQPFQLSLLSQEFQLDELHYRQDGEKDARTIRGKQDCGEIQAEFFSCEQSDCVEKPGDTQSFKSTGWSGKRT